MKKKKIIKIFDLTGYFFGTAFCLIIVGVIFKAFGFDRVAFLLLNGLLIVMIIFSVIVLVMFGIEYIKFKNKSSKKIKKMRNGK